MLRRIYLEKNGLVYESNYAESKSKIYYRPAKDKNPVDGSTVRKRNFRIVSKSNFQNFLSKNTVIMTNYNNNNGGAPFAVQGAEDAYGNRGTYREEYASKKSYSKILKLVLENRDPANTHCVVVGDHHGLIGDKLGLTQLSHLVVAGGTYGPLSLALWKQIVGATPLDLHQLHLISESITVNNDGTPNTNPPVPPTISGSTASDNFFTMGSLSQVEADIAMQSLHESEIPLQFQVGSGSFNTNIRSITEFRMQMFALNGLKINLPPLTRLTLSTYINAVGVVYGMKQINSGC